MTVTCDRCTAAVNLPGETILRQLLEYGEANYCQPCEKEWMSI